MKKSEKPILAITMGDPAGIGAEIIAKAFSTGEIHDVARCLVIGDSQVMKLANKIAGTENQINSIRKVDEAKFRAGAIDVLDLKNVDLSQLQMGQISAMAGDAAYEYIVKAIELAKSGLVDGTVTAPIHKEALNLAGHHFPGHTEIYAELTGTKDFAMLLVDENLRVIHVCTHVPVREIPEYVKKDRVYRVIRLLNDACRRFGVDQPKIGVAGALYVAARIAGKMIGTRMGQKWAGTSEPNSLYLGMGMLSQAGLAIGLSSWAAKEMPVVGEPLAAIILSTTAVFEIIGPVLTRVSLIRGGEVKIIKLLSSMTVGGFKAQFEILADRLRQAFGVRRRFQHDNFSGPVRVRHLMRYHIDQIPPDAGLDKIVKIMEHSRHSMLPVIGKQSQWIGMIFLTDIRDLFFNKDLGRLIIAQDIAHDMAVLSPDDSLEHAMQVFENEAVPFLPVVESNEQKNFQGVIHRRDIYLFQVDRQKEGP